MEGLSVRHLCIGRSRFGWRGQRRDRIQESNHRHGVAVGEELYSSDILQAAGRNGVPASEILGQILERLNGYEPQEQRKGDKNVSRESQRNGP